MSEHTHKRFWEVDSLRGVAIIMMVLVHLRYDLVIYGGHGGPFLLAYGFWRDFARTTASIFLFLVGVSLTLSLARAQKTAGPERRLFPKYLKRGLTIFGWGMGITVVTWVLLREGAVWFGILHCIGASIILAYPFLRWRWPNLFIGLALVAVGVVLSQRTYNFPWLMWLGFIPQRLGSVDYYPLLPNFGIVLIGIFAGNLLYAGFERRFPWPEASHLAPLSVLSFLGRHSLAIYLIHQPIIITLLSLTGIINPGFV